MKRYRDGNKVITSTKKAKLRMNIKELPIEILTIIFDIIIYSFSNNISTITINDLAQLYNLKLVCARFYEVLLPLLQKKVTFTKSCKLTISLSCNVGKRLQDKEEIIYKKDKNKNNFCLNSYLKELNTIKNRWKHGEHSINITYSHKTKITINNNKINYFFDEDAPKSSNKEINVSIKLIDNEEVILNGYLHPTLLENIKHNIKSNGKTKLHNSINTIEYNRYYSKFSGLCFIKLNIDLECCENNISMKHYFSMNNIIPIKLAHFTNKQIKKCKQIEECTKETADLDSISFNCGQTITKKGNQRTINLIWNTPLESSRFISKKDPKGIYAFNIAFFGNRDITSFIHIYYNYNGKLFKIIDDKIYCYIYIIDVDVLNELNISRANDKYIKVEMGHSLCKGKEEENEFKYEMVKKINQIISNLQLHLSTRQFISELTKTYNYTIESM